MQLLLLLTPMSSVVQLGMRFLCKKRKELTAQIKLDEQLLCHSSIIWNKKPTSGTPCTHSSIQLGSWYVG